MGRKPLAERLAGPEGDELKKSRERGVQVKNRDKPRKFPERWSAEEHEQFVEGVRQLGKGEYRQIAAQFVKTRTYQQVPHCASRRLPWFASQQRSRSAERPTILRDRARSNLLLALPAASLVSRHALRSARRCVPPSTYVILTAACGASWIRRALGV